MSIPSSSSSVDPPHIHHQSLTNPSSSKPTLTSPSPQSPSPSPPVYIAQPLPKNLHPPHMAKIPEPSIPPPPPPPHPQAILYPVASSGRGFIPKVIRPQSTDQLVTVANPGGFLPRSAAPFSNQVLPLGFPPSDLHPMRPPSVHPSRQMVGAVSAGPVKTIPAVGHSKVTSLPSSASDVNAYKELRDISRDDTIVTINDRKVRLSDGASLYALCRSWVRNGLPQESQPQFGEGINIFPRPLPASVSDTSWPKINDEGDEDEEKEDVGSVEHLSARDLLERHVKRAKRVRARLRVERLLRIQRYKPRLALLLPSSFEQFQNDGGFEQF